MSRRLELRPPAVGYGVHVALEACRGDGSIGGKAGGLGADRDGREAPRAGPKPRVRTFHIKLLVVSREHDRDGRTAALGLFRQGHELGIVDGLL
jgi:hypothetical protein